MKAPKHYNFHSLALIFLATGSFSLVACAGCGGTLVSRVDTPTGTVTVRPGAYPPQTVAYFRWIWDELEPAEGQYNFGLVDGVIQRSQANGKTLAFRIMTVYKGLTSQWVLEKVVDSIAVGGDVFPDHNNPLFLHYHELLLIKALGNRYSGRPEIDPPESVGVHRVEGRHGPQRQVFVCTDRMAIEC